MITARRFQTALLVLGAAVFIAVSTWVAVVFPDWVLIMAYLALAVLLILLDALWRARQRQAALQVVDFDALPPVVLGRHLAVLVGALPGWQARAPSGQVGVVRTVNAKSADGRTVLFVLTGEDVQWLVDLRDQLGVSAVVQVAPGDTAAAPDVVHKGVWLWQARQLVELQGAARTRNAQPPAPLKAV